MSELEVADEVAVVPRQFPGQLLRQTREAQGLTLGEVAGALKFSTRQIEALERDDYQQLQGKTFLRGFIRSYARLLKLQPEPLLDMLEVETIPIAEQIVVPANMGETEKISFHRRHGKKLIVAMVVVLLAAGGGFYVLNRDELAIEHHVQPVDVPVDASVAVPLPADASASTAPAVSATAADPAASNNSTAVATATSAQNPATLVFEFSDRSWLEVKDAGGQILLTGEFLTGQTQTVTGKPPYQLWVGKTSAVKVNYGGRNVDLQPYARDEVARLTLDPQ